MSALGLKDWCLRVLGFCGQGSGVAELELSQFGGIATTKATTPSTPLGNMATATLDILELLMRLLRQTHDLRTFTDL